MTSSSSIINRHHPCPSCGSSDAASTYLNEDGSISSYCFSCGAWKSDKKNMEETKRKEGLLSVSYTDLRKRGIKEETCRRAGYGVSSYMGGVHVADYRWRDRVCSQHVRTPDKQFTWIQHQPKLELFGQHLWQPGGKEIIITEGEIDMLTWFEIRGYKWPVVGALGVKDIDIIKNNLEFISSFESVYIYTDMDDQGRGFAEEIAELLPPGTAYIGSTGTYKDSNEMYLAEGQGALFNTKWQCKPWHPAELTTPREVLNQTPPSIALNYGWEGLNDLLGGIHHSEMITLCAGTSIGKSLVAKQMAYHFLKQGKKVGFIALEETSRSVLEQLLAFDQGVPVEQLNMNELPTYLDQAEWEDNLTFYTDRGGDLSEVIFPRIRWMRHAQDVDIVFIDHISAIFARFDGNQREQIDKFLYSMQALCKEIDLPIISVVHLRDPQTGSNHSEGAMPRLNELNGSSALSRVPATILGLRREVLNEESKHLTEMYVLKSRHVGMSSGKHITLTMEDGVMVETDEQIKHKEEVDGKDYGF